MSLPQSKMASLEEAVSARKRALDASASYLQFLWKADLVESWIREWVGTVGLARG